MTAAVDLRNIANGDRLTVTLADGEELTATVTGYEHDPADDYSAGFVSFSFEGGLWEQVNDRVDSEVLHVRQSLARESGRPGEVEIYGTVWPNAGGGEPGEPEYVELGEVALVSWVADE